jgi:hypothetical protein
VVSTPVLGVNKPEENGVESKLDPVPKPTLLPPAIIEEEQSLPKVDQQPIEDDVEEEVEFEEAPRVETPQKTPWQQLWQDLAEFAGVHDPE